MAKIRWLSDGKRPDVFGQNRKPTGAEAFRQEGRGGFRAIAEQKPPTANNNKQVDNFRNVKRRGGYAV